MLITTDGIIIRERQVGENDKYIDILTPNYGVLEASVKGVKKITSKNLSSTQLFAYSNICLQNRGQRYYLNSSEPIHIFYELRFDVVKLSLASYFSDLIRFTVSAEEAAPEILRLFLNCLNYLTTNERSCDFIKCIFELRLLSELGMMPNVVACSECMVYSADKMYFLLKDAKLLCTNCFNGVEDEATVAITPAILNAIRHIVLSDFEKLFSFKLSKESQIKLSYISENYLHMHLGRSFKTLDFYKSIQLI